MDNDNDDGEAMACDWSDHQLSMIASAIAGGQVLCCEHGATTRETICTTSEQLEQLAQWAHECAGCGHLKLSREKPGEFDPSPYDACIETYLRNFWGFAP